MARPREFEIDDALRAASEVFLAKGYHAASIEDLLGGTGLTKGSLYKAFRDKKTLFIATLDLYARESRERFSQTLGQPGSPKAAIRQSLMNYVDRAVGPWPLRGCLITNTAVELGSQEPDIASHLSETFRLRTELFVGAVRQAQDAGEIDGSKDPLALADYLETTVQGLRVMARVGPSVERMAEVVELAVSVL